MQPLRIEIADSLPALLALEDQLAALAAAAGAGAFDRPGFFLPWARAAAATGQRPACLCLWRGADLAGFAPVFRRRDWKALLAWRGGPPVFGASPAFDLLLAPEENSQELTTALVQALERMRWIDLSFASLPEGNRLARILSLAFDRQGYSVRQSPGQRFYSVEGVASGAELEAQLSSKNRRALRSAERKLDGCCEVTLHTSETGPDPAVGILRKVVIASWKDCPRMRKTGLQLYEEQIRGCANDGTLRFWSASHQGEPVAFAFVLAEPRGPYHGYFTAATGLGRELGAGTALMYQSLKHSLDEGASMFNLWTTRHNLKRMANSQLRTVSLDISRAGLGARMRLSAAEQLRLLRQALRTQKPRPRT